MSLLRGIEKERERERTAKERQQCLTSTGRGFHREQKAQDKPGNLAAKPFFLGIISTNSLARSSRIPLTRTTRNPRPISCRQYLHPASSRLYRSPLFSVVSLAISLPPPSVSSPFRSLFLSYSFRNTRSLSGTPDKSAMTDSAVRGVDVCRTDETQERIFVRFGPSRARKRYLRNAKYLAT